MDEKDLSNENVEIKNGEKDVQLEKRNGETNTNDDTVEDETEENEAGLGDFDCREGETEKKDLPSELGEEKTSENNVVENSEEKQQEREKEEAKAEAETSNLQNELNTSQEKSGEKEIKLTETEKEDKETQTETPQKKEKDCSPSSMDTLVQDLLQQIECPVCFEYMVPPITQCSNGHNICKTCRPSLGHCPTCRGLLTEVKNNAMAILSNSITHPCKFRKSGCTGQFLVEFKEQHEDACAYGPHICPFSILKSCLWEGTVPDMKQHILISHKYRKVGDGKELITYANYPTSITPGSNLYQAMFTLDNVFFTYTEVVENLLHMALMFVGSKDDDKNFKYTINMKTKDGNQSVTSCFRCPNYLDFTDGKFPKEKCAVFYTEFTRQCVQDDILEFDFEISQY